MKTFAGNDCVRSPRWGHEDPYRLTLTAEALTVRRHADVITCRIRPDDRPGAGHGGWGGTHLRYTVSPDGRTSNEACGVILVAPAVTVRVCDRHRTADWTEIAHLIAGW